MKNIFPFLMLNMLSALCLAQSTQTINTPEEIEINCGGVKRWKVKVFTDPSASLVDFTPKNTSIAHLVSLPAPLFYFYMPRQPMEDSTYVITCKITIKKIEK